MKPNNKLPAGRSIWPWYGKPMNDLRLATIKANLARQQHK